MHVRIGRTHTQSVDYWPKYSTQACTIHCARLAHRTVATLVGCRAYQLSVNGRQIGSGVDIKRVFTARCYASAAFAVMQCPSVRPSVTFVDHVKTNKDIFEIFSPSGNDTILLFPSQRGCRYSDGNPPNGGVECKMGMIK